MRRIAILLAALVLPGTASAHVVLTQKTATAGSYHAATFRVGHGCGSEATQSITVRIPNGVVTARPQPKPGWTMDIERDGARVTAITWRGLLPPDQFDDFAVLMKLPTTEGELAFPVIQRCGDQTSPWDGSSAGRPVPVLTLTPGTGSTGGGHEGH